MDIFNALSLDGPSDQDTAFQEMMKIKVVDMHTSGEPTRIIISGYPALQGRTLLEKRAYARTPSWDGTRKWLMREPRGHAEMYGAILIAETELTQSGDADIGVLFCHNEGYSTMCGHATLALGRFLVDTQDEDVFPRRKSLIPSTRTGFVFLRIHAPCGVIRVEVPITPKGLSDPSKPVEFLGVPSFVGGMDVMVDIPSDNRWKMLSASGRTSVRLDVAYGGAFYAIVDAPELGFKNTLLAYPVSELAEAAKMIKALVGKKSELLAHPIHHDLEFLYGVIITEKQVGKNNWEGGICFFANNQIDRSPTGSGVCARVALSVVKDGRHLGQICAYDSIYSVLKEDSCFWGTPTEKVLVKDGRQAVIVQVSGKSHYISAATMVMEVTDSWAEGITI